MTDKVEVEVRRNGRSFVAEAVLDLGADLQSVWDTITDYAALPRFMPGIRACKVNTREQRSDGSEHLVVEQQGEFRFLLFAQSMKVLLNIEQQPLQWAQAKAVRFELGLFTRRAIEVFEGRYALSAISTDAQSPRTHLSYTATIGLRLPPPPAIGNVAVKQNLVAQLEAVAREVARRMGRVTPPLR
jgi:phage baseplate assembly protein W